MLEVLQKRWNAVKYIMVMDGKKERKNDPTKSKGPFPGNPISNSDARYFFGF
jgi:hypothetical protein